MSGFILRGKSLNLSLNLYTEENKELPFLSLIGRLYRLQNMLEKRQIVLSEWESEIKNLISQDIIKIQKELVRRRRELRDVENKISHKKEVYKVRLDVITQKNGSKFYRGRINIPKTDRENFNLKTPRKEFLINRNEIKILVGRMKHLKLPVSESIIRRPTKIVNGKKILDTPLGQELQYLVYEKYVQFLKDKLK